MFDEFLQERTKTRADDAESKPFDIEKDYRRYVDGKPRYAGVKSFLGSRDIELPEGVPGDSPEERTVCGLGNRKNAYFHQMLKEGGVQVFGDAVSFVRSLRSHGIKTAVVSSSKNCTAVLKAARIRGLFDVQMDGTDIDGKRIKGKPHPDIFLEAAKRLGVSPARAAVVEDAEAGVEAGRRGNFALVVGVDRVGCEDVLKKSGADCVISDFDKVYVE